MAEEHSPAEVKHRYMEAMGIELGELFYLLWNECCLLHWKWSDYLILFGSKPERISILNRAAPAFYRIIQDAMWEDILVHLCRLTDPPESCGKATLTLKRLPPLVPLKIRAEVSSLLQETIEKSTFARDWRNRRIAHKDLALASRNPVVPLAHASRKSVKEAIKSIVCLLNYVEDQHCHSTTMYEFISQLGNAESLLHVLRDGIEFDDARMRKRRSGNPFPEDMRPRAAV